MPAAESSRNDLTGGFWSGLIEDQLEPEEPEVTLGTEQTRDMSIGTDAPDVERSASDPSSRSRQLPRPARRPHPQPRADRHQRPPAWVLSREPLLPAGGPTP